MILHILLINAAYSFIVSLFEYYSFLKIYLMPTQANNSINPPDTKYTSLAHGPPLPFLH